MYRGLAQDWPHQMVNGAYHAQASWTQLLRTLDFYIFVLEETCYKHLTRLTFERKESSGLKIPHQMKEFRVSERSSSHLVASSTPIRRRKCYRTQGTILQHDGQPPLCHRRSEGSRPLRKKTLWPSASESRYRQDEASRDSGSRVQHKAAVSKEHLSEAVQ